MSPPIVTVLITTHNYARFIGDAIDSALSQDFPSERVDILVVDDGSTDNTADRVAKYGSRVRYVYKENGGQASALNLGIAEARGDVIALLDADDVLLPGKLARVAAAFQSDPSLGMVYHRLLEWNTITGERREADFVAISGDLRKTPERSLLFTPYATSAICLRRSVLGPLLPIPERIRMLADAFLVDLVPFLAPVLAIPECLTLYRIHSANHYYANEQAKIPPEVRKKRQLLKVILLDEMRQWLARNGYDERQPQVRSFLNRWRFYQWSDEFALNPPGRLRLFFVTLFYNHCYGPHISWRLRTINYFNAVGSLLTGYKHFHLLDKLRLGVTVSARQAIKEGRQWISSTDSKN